MIVAAALIVTTSALRLDAANENWKAGTARTTITPSKPLWMAGYGSRTAPAQGTFHDLYVRVLVLEDAAGHRGIILTSDTLGIPKLMYDEICETLESRYGLNRSQVMLNASHTHCGPVLKGALLDIYPLNDGQLSDINEYSDWLVSEIVAAIGRAMDDLQPATISRGVGTSDFAVNRRMNREPDVPVLRENNLLLGPVDHTVPVLAVKDATGNLKAVVFTYACHNTTLDFQQWCGDYAGFAQLSLETRYPGVTAMFCMGCGADQNPIPRRTLEVCQKYGERLSTAVQSVLDRPLIPVLNSLETRHAFVPLVMDPLPATGRLQDMAAAPVSYQQRWAVRQLNQIQSGIVPPSVYQYPVQAWRLGGDQLWIALGGEVVVDYSLRLKAELGEGTWINAYANDVMAYIPSKRVLLEGGYEGQSSMMVYGLPAERWASDIEDRVVEGVIKVVRSLDH